MNEQELEELYRATAPRLRRYLGRLVDHADDLTQETFYRYLRAGYTASGEDRVRILFTIATNLARNAWTRTRTHEELHERTRAVDADPIERIDLIAALRNLSPRERALLWLTHAEGYEHREVARMMGMAQASVRVLLFRARRKLARLMERER
ncbi:MAG: RNA polymerase sigma factor [Acidobacteria bacterium]|nr:RNA polymerase sigma factor [Acidobacteriota bacterium]MBV9478481.1 RNA polymerase sigma factor [Acidobacteriota bacterium]